MRQRIARHLLLALVFAVSGRPLFAVGGTVELITRAANPSTAPISSAGLGSFSADGRYLAFVSNDPALVGGTTDSNDTLDVYLYDRVAATTTLVSHAAGANTTTADGQSTSPVVSGDGSTVAFVSTAQNLVSGQVPSFREQEVYVWDRATNTTRLASHASGSATTIPNGYSLAPGLSSDGRYVAFFSSAGNLASGVTAGQLGVYLWDSQGDVMTLVSHSASSSTTVGNAASFDPMISADSNYVAFVSYATNLVSGQTGPAGNVFLWTRSGGAITLVSSQAGAATTAVGGALSGISSDGAYVAWLSAATNAVSGQTDSAGTNDIFRYDRVAGTSTLVSHAAGSSTTTGNAGSYEPAMSADGAYVAFASTATNLVSGVTDTADQDVFLWQASDGSIALVSHTAGSTATSSASDCYAPTINGDGSWVAFLSQATDLVSGQTGIGQQVFAYQRSNGSNYVLSHAHGQPAQGANAAAQAVILAGTSTGSFAAFQDPATDLVSPALTTSAANVVYLEPLAPTEATQVSTPNQRPVTGDADSWTAAISADGQSIALISRADNLVAGATVSLDQVYLFDRAAKTFTLVSHAAGSTTTAGNGYAQSVGISSNGRFVVYTSTASNLVAGQTDDSSSADVFLWDRQSNTNVLVTRADGALTTALGGNFAVISADGSTVIFTSGATSLVAGQTDGNGGTDVFAYDRIADSVTLVSHTPASPTTAGDGVSSAPVVSENGQVVAFQSNATNLVTGESDANSASDVYVYDRGSGTMSLASRTAGSATTAGSAASSSPAISGDGGYVAFQSAAVDLGGSTFGRTQIWLYDRVAATNTLASHNLTVSTQGGNNYSFVSPGALSRDGSALVFSSLATDLTSETDTNSAEDVFVFERGSGTVRLVSLSATTPTATASGDSTALGISADGQFVLLASSAADLVAGQVGVAFSNLFLADLGTANGNVSLVSHAPASIATSPNSYSGPASMSGDGAFVAFVSGASNLVADDYNDAQDVFLFSRQLDYFTLTPCRVIDTRQTTAVSSGVALVVPFYGACGVPAGAKAVSVNLTITQPTGAGFVVLYPSSLPVPLASTINFQKGQTRANNAVVPLDPTGLGTLSVRPGIPGGGTVQVILDVSGYFR